MRSFRKPRLFPLRRSFLSERFGAKRRPDAEAFGAGLGTRATAAAGAEDAIFANPDFDPVQYEKDLAKRSTEKSLAILFTPRSGSSWVTDVLTKTKRLGRPQEWFNPNFIPEISQKLNANSAETYIEMVRRKHSPGGVFSFELTAHQMIRIFGSEDRFLSLLPPPTTFVYLIREDIVLQAVSLAKAVSTSVFHTATAKPEEIVEADQAFRYDAPLIERWLKHIADQERKSDAFFATHGITPVCLSYEKLTEAGTDAIVRRFLSMMHPSGPAEVPKIETAHLKIGTSRNSEFALRFREDRPSVVTRIEEQRMFDRASSGQ